MQHLKIRTIVIFVTGVAAATLSFGSAAKAESVTERARGNQTAAATYQTFPRAKSVSSGSPLAHEPNSPSLIAKRGYSRAALLFPPFCREWEQKLRNRELNNRANIHWDSRDGFKVGNYVGYSPIQTCECKESPTGLPIGKLTYQEFNYYISGKTMDEAKQATPKVMHTTSTLEIFSWDRERWFY